MNDEIFFDTIFLKFKKKKLEKKFKKRNFSEKRILFVMFLVFALSLTNSIFLSNYYSDIINQIYFCKNETIVNNSINSNQTLNQNDNFLQNNILISYANQTLLKYSEDRISQIKNFNYFIFYYLCSLLFFKIIFSFITFFKTQNNKNKNQLKNHKYSKTQNYNDIKIKNAYEENKIENKGSFTNNKDIEKNIEISNKKLTNIKEKKEDLKLKKLKFFFTLNLTISFSIIYIYQLDVLKFLCAFYFENTNLYYFVFSLETLNCLYFIIYVFSDHIIITLAIFLAKSLKFLFLKSIENSNKNVYWDSDHNIFNVIYIIAYLFASCHLAYYINFNKRFNFYLRYVSKLDLKKTTDILENLNSGFISFGENMQFNFNKKFSQIFTNLVNDIFSTEKKNENTISLLKLLKLEDYLDEGIKSKNTAQFFGNEPNEKIKKPKTKKTSMININKTFNLERENNLIKSVKKNDFSEKDDLKKSKDLSIFNKKGKSQEGVCENSLSSDIILLLLFFDKENIQIDENLDIEIIKFIDERIFISLNSEQVITDIINFDFINNFKNIEKKTKPRNNAYEKSINIIKHLGPYIHEKNFFKTFPEQYNSNNFQNQKYSELVDHISKNISNNIIEEDKNIPEIVRKSLNDNSFNNSYCNFLNNFSFNNPVIENKFKEKLSSQSINILNKQEFNNININYFLTSNINDNNFYVKYNSNKNLKISKESNNLENQNCEFNLNKAFINYLNSKKAHFCTLINLIKEKYSKQNEFFPFFTFKKKFEDQEEGREIDTMEIKVYFRYNNLSNKIELLFNDLSYILKIANFKAQSKIKKKFLKKFSHEFRNPLLNIVQMIKNLKEEKIEKFMKKACMNYSIYNPINGINNSSSINNYWLQGNEFPKEKSTFEENRLLTEQQNSDCDKTVILSRIDFEAVAETARNILENENKCTKSKKKNYTLSSHNSTLNNKEKNNCLLSKKKLSEKIIAKELLENLEEKFFYSSPTNYQNFSKKFHSEKTLVKDFQTNNKDSSYISASKDNNNPYKGSLNNYSRTSFYNNNSNNFNNYNKNMPNKSDSLKYKLSQISQKKENSLKANITNFNHIKYTCYYMNYLINDFDFITNHDINYKESKKTNNSKKLNNQDSLKMLEKNKYEKDVEVYNKLPTGINIHKLLRKLVNIIRSKIILAEKKIDVILEIDITVPFVIKSSLEKITQILFNLLSNSMKFTKFGCINLKVNYDNIDSKLIFNIMDTGIGIKEELIKNIFKPFYKSKDEKNNMYGMGMGLYIVKLHIESLNGEIFVKSLENKNTQVYFYIIIEAEGKEKKFQSGIYETPKIINDLNPSIRKVFDLIEYENNKNSDVLNNPNKGATNLNEKNKCFKNTKLSNPKRINKTESESQRINHNTSNLYPEISINNNNILFSQRCNTSLHDTLNLSPNLYIDSENFENINNNNILFKGSSEISKFKNLKSLFCSNNQEKLLENYLQQDYLDRNIEDKHYNIYHTIISQKFKTDNILFCSPKRSILRLNSNTDFPLYFLKRNKSLNIKDPKFLDKYSKLNIPEKYYLNDKFDKRMRCKTDNFINKINDLKGTNKISNKKNSPHLTIVSQKPNNSINIIDDQKDELSNETICLDKDLQINYKNLKTYNEINKNFITTIVNDNNSESNFSFFIGTPEINKRNLNSICSNSQNKSNQLKNINTDPELSNSIKKENLISKLINNENNFNTYMKSNDEFNINCQIVNKNEIIFKDSQINIIVVDDEKLIRQSNINLIKKYFKNKSTIYQVFECEDGFSCLNYIYQAKLGGKEIDYIITDQTMNHITGTLLSEIIGLLVEHKIINDIKMFLLTSYSANLFNKQQNRFLKVFSKPFRLEYLELIFKDISS